MKTACFAAVLAFTTLAGCAAPGRAIGIGTGVAILAMNAQGDRVNVVYAPPGSSVQAEQDDDEPGAIPDAPPKREPHGPQFQREAARNNLGAVTMDACKDVAGMQTGWGHARVTFQPSGDVSAIVIDRPSGMSEDAVTCVSERLARVSVPEFAGAPVSVGTTWNVQ